MATDTGVSTSDARRRAPVAGSDPSLGGKVRKSIGAVGLRSIQSVVVIILLIGFWELAVRKGWVSRLTLAAPSDISKSIYREIGDGSLWRNTSVTLERVALGYGLAVLIALPAGLVLGSSRLARRLLSGLLELLRPVPPIALIPVTILWLGIGDSSKVAIIAYAAVWPILLNVILGVQSVPLIVQNTARTLGIRNLAYFRKVVMPSAMPQIVVGLRLSGAIAFVVVVAAEMVAASSGLGFQILDAERTFRTPDMFAGIVVLAVLGAAVNVVLLQFERIVTRWK